MTLSDLQWLIEIVNEWHEASRGLSASAERLVFQYTVSVVSKKFSLMSTHRSLRASLRLPVTAPRDIACTGMII